MHQKIPWEKLAKYFAGELTEQESKQMKSWIKENRRREKQVHYLFEIWKESGVLPFQSDVDKAWERLSKNMDSLEKENTNTFSIPVSGQKREQWLHHFKNQRRVNKKTGSAFRRTALLAASVLIALTAGLFAHQYYVETQQADMMKEIGMEELTTREGEKAKYTLNDGSKIILHAGSRIKIPLSYNKINRELHLEEGEAYFEVTHDPEKPFIVRSGEAYTRVLGTKFLVQAWPDVIDNNIEVVVEEGKVAFGKDQKKTASNQDEVVITRNQKGILRGEGGPRVNNITDMNWYVGWVEGRLRFEDRKLSEILPRLEHWYAVKIVTEDETIDEKKLTAEIDYSQPMMEVLKGIALSLDLTTIEKKERVVTFRLKDEN